MRNKKSAINILIYLLIALVFSSSVSAQVFFGKNKVQYTNFDWQVMVTDHFKIYFYSDEAEVASIGAKLAEDSYRTLAAKFNFEVPKKIPLVIYSTPSFFAQTNIIPGLLPESVGGFTEFMKGRVVVPFTGSYFAFDHVIRHELVHVFTIARLDEITQRRSRFKFANPPLWFIEGLAEFWSKDWDTQADMVIRDMVLNDRFISIPEMYRINGTYYMYKTGESICHFIDSTYGSDKLVKIFDNWHKGRNFDHVIQITLGDNLKELSRKWEYYLKKKYYPSIDTLGLPDMESEQLTFDGYNAEAAPIRWDDGSGEKDWIVFKANRIGYSGIYMKPAKGYKGDVKTLIKGNKSSEFESLHLLRSSLDTHPSGRIVFSAKSKEKDVLYIYDLNKMEVTERHEFDSLYAVRSPRFSNDGKKIVFSGVKKDGYTDIYLYSITDSTYQAVTTDIYLDHDPAFTKDDSKIIFRSDRSTYGYEGYTNLFSLDLEDYSISQLTYGKYRDQSPEPTDNGIFFVSDREGVFNIFHLDSLSNITTQSVYATGVMTPRVLDGKKLYYTGYQKMGFNIYSMKLPEEPKKLEPATDKNLVAWKPKLISNKYRKSSIRYDTDYSFDIAQSSIGYDPVYGSIGGVQAALSDVLGNHAIYLLLTNTAQTKDEFLESFNFGATYINRQNRMNWGMGAFHLYDEYFNDYDGYFYQRQIGGIGLISYPLSKFQRIDFTNYTRYSKRFKYFGIPIWEKALSTQYVSWVFDNTLWDITGPLEGRRYNFSVGVTVSLNDQRNWNRMYVADIRHYFRLGKYSAFANRLFAYKSTGQQPQRIYFGGSWSFRGYDRRDFYAPNVLFASNELRFPLVDNLYLGFPFGGIGFYGIRGALFFDIASIWEKEFDQFIGSFGGGFRVALGRVLVLRFDFTRKTDFEKIDDKTDFDFFFGWNF